MMIEEERSMKKLIATALALTMTLSLSTTALAGGNVDGAGVGSLDPIDVTAKYNDDATEPTVYSVDLTWEDMTFTYNESGTRIWDPDTHTYTDTTSAGWDKVTAAVTATNHSNTAVTVSFTYTPQGNTGVTASMSKLSFILDAGVENYPKGENIMNMKKIGFHAGCRRSGLHHEHHCLCRRSGRRRHRQLLR